MLTNLVQHGYSRDMSAEQLPVPTNDQEPLNGIPQAIDVSDTKSLPEWFASMPLKAQQILCLVSLGLSHNSIEKAFSLSDGTVKYYVREYLKGRVLTLSPAHRASLQSAIVQAQALRVVSHITDNDLESAPLRDKAYAAKALSETADRLGSRANAPTVEFTDLDNKLKVRIGK